MKALAILLAVVGLVCFGIAGYGLILGAAEPQCHGSALPPGEVCTATGAALPTRANIKEGETYVELHRRNRRRGSFLMQAYFAAGAGCLFGSLGVAIGRSRARRPKRSKAVADRPVRADLMDGSYAAFVAGIPGVSPGSTDPPPGPPPPGFTASSPTVPPPADPSTDPPG